MKCVVACFTTKVSLRYVHIFHKMLLITIKIMRKRLILCLVTIRQTIRYQIMMRTKVTLRDTGAPKEVTTLFGLGQTFGSARPLYHPVFNLPLSPFWGQYLL